MQQCLYLGNLDARRDWGHARDYVEAQWLMLQQDQAEDFVIATGESRSVREFVEIAAARLGMRLVWEGRGADQVGRVESCTGDAVPLERGSVVVRIDPRYLRPSEVDSLVGDASRARAKLGWTPRTHFEDLVREMVDADFEAAQRDRLVRAHGYSASDRRE
jgi:GDPmannose 4,6-dehydratase